MPLNHSNATAIFSLKGLFVFCFSQDDSTCQVGAIKPNPDNHNFTIQIFKNGAAQIPHSLNLNSDLQIDVSKPTNVTCTRYGTGINRAQGTGDPQDFQWILDLEGPEFYNQATTIPSQNAFKSVITIAGGLYYAANVNKQPLYRVTVGQPNSQVFLGRVADIIGIDLTGSSVTLQNAGGANAIQLPGGPGNQYSINIDNSDIAPADTTTQSDFQLYYAAVNPPAALNVRFDVVKQVKPRAGGQPTHDGYPEFCDGALLGLHYAL